MSHFTVLVIGENIDQQLAPFHEFECTGTNDEFVKDKEGSIIVGGWREVGTFTVEKS